MAFGGPQPRVGLVALPRQPSPGIEQPDQPEAGGDQGQPAAEDGPEGHWQAQGGMVWFPPSAERCMGRARGSKSRRRRRMGATPEKHKPSRVRFESGAAVTYWHSRSLALRAP
jgi:hypothetical protein